MRRDFNYYCRICLSYCILKDNGLETLKIVLKNTYLYTLRLESGYYQEGDKPTGFWFTPTLRQTSGEISKGLYYCVVKGHM